jgi:hypothetical protein
LVVPALAQEDDNTRAVRMLDQAPPSACRGACDHLRALRPEHQFTAAADPAGAAARVPTTSALPPWRRRRPRLL